MFIRMRSLKLVKIDRFKRKAVMWHLLISALLTVVVAVWMFMFWLPAPFSVAAGALTGLVILLSVDMCLGPALTFLLMHSRKSKREFFVDAIVVAALQVSALVFGLWQVNLARPAAVVFWQDSFYLVKAADFIQRYGKVPDLSELSHEKVPVIYARYPLLLDELQNLEHSIRDGLVPYEQTSLYLSVTKGLAEISKSPVDIAVLLLKYPELQTQLDELGDRTLQQQFIYSRLHSEYGQFLLVLGPQGQLFGLLNLPA